MFVPLTLILGFSPSASAGLSLVRGRKRKRLQRAGCSLVVAVAQMISFGCLVVQWGWVALATAKENDRTPLIDYHAR